MSNDIEKLIEHFVVPEMEVAPEAGRTKKRRAKLKTKSVTITLDDVPEVVLPKTKAQMYEEARGRLKQKTSPASRRAKKTSPQRETAAAQAADPPQDIAPSRADNPVWVGEESEIVPFAWRHPLIAGIQSPSKYYKQVMRENRDALLPAPHGR